MQKTPEELMYCLFVSIKPIRDGLPIGDLTIFFIQNKNNSHTLLNNPIRRQYTIYLISPIQLSTRSARLAIYEPDAWLATAYIYSRQRF
jgi:hypothetical protein